MFGSELVLQGNSLRTFRNLSGSTEGDFSIKINRVKQRSRSCRRNHSSKGLKELAQELFRAAAEIPAALSKLELFEYHLFPHYTAVNHLRKFGCSSATNFASDSEQTEPRDYEVLLTVTPAPRTTHHLNLAYSQLKHHTQWHSRHMHTQ